MKLKLEDLKVQSFVTAIEKKEEKEIIAGIKYASRNGNICTAWNYKDEWLC